MQYSEINKRISYKVSDISNSRVICFNNEDGKFGEDFKIIEGKANYWSKRKFIKYIVWCIKNAHL